MEKASGALSTSAANFNARSEWSHCHRSHYDADSCSVVSFVSMKRQHSLTVSNNSWPRFPTQILQCKLAKQLSASQPRNRIECRKNKKRKQWNEKWRKERKKTESKIEYRRARRRIESRIFIRMRFGRVLLFWLSPHKLSRLQNFNIMHFVFIPNDLFVQDIVLLTHCFALRRHRYTATHTHQLTRPSAATNDAYMPFPFSSFYFLIRGRFCLHFFVYLLLFPVNSD